jgi:F-type H+-transporting ATPase subunit a
MEEHPGTWLNALERLLPHQVQEYVTINVLTAWLVLIGLVVLVRVGTRRMELRPVSGLQVMWEWVVEAFTGFCKTMIGPNSEQYVPFLGTLFMYILLLNLLGLVPGFVSPTASLTMTGALGLTAFVYVQICGFRAQGMKYLLHFVGEPIWLAPLNLPIHVIGELARPLSLSIRLFGNIFGEDVVIAQLLAMSAGIFAVIYVPIPLHLPMVLFHIFISFVQALVFMMLTGAYIAGAVVHEGGEHEDEH